MKNANRLGGSSAWRSLARFGVCVGLVGAGCGGGSGASPGDGGGGAPDLASPPQAPIAAAFDLHADLSQGAHFWDFPWPSDLRLTASGAPDVNGFPNDADLRTINGPRKLTLLRKGFPLLPVAYFQFSGDLRPRHFTDVIPGDKKQPVMLVDLGSGPGRGQLTPVVAETPPPDRYVPLDGILPEGGRPIQRLLALAPRPGFVLSPRRKYAFVVLRSLGNAAGDPLLVPPALAALKAATPPPADPELKAWKLYQDLWTVLGTLGLDVAEVAAATVFTTGSPVEDTFDLSSKVLARYSIQVTGLAVRPDGNQGRNCELTGKVTYPEFQDGTPPFNQGGILQVDGAGMPVKQRDEDAPLGISLPQMAMPAAGYPLVLYIHGSGGLSTQLFDRGKYINATTETPHQGPAYVLAPFGFAVAGSAMPVNPERLPGATDLAYINFNNLAAFTGTFVQGVIEQRLLLDALARLTIDPKVVAGCPGLSLPQGASAYKLDLSRLVAQGQSMGGQYVNMLSAVEPRIQAVAPSGAGGYWSYVVITTHAIAAAEATVKLLLGTDQPLTPLHPALSLLQSGWEGADALVYMPRIGKDPLPGHPVRSVYEPVGLDDEYFSPPIYDATALAYGHREAGEVVWPTMQAALSLDGKDGLVSYPVSKNLTSAGGGKYTGAVIQYRADGIVDSHYIFQQLDAVKYQYGCFLSTFVQRGVATIPAPAALGTPCP